MLWCNGDTGAGADRQQVPLKVIRLGNLLQQLIAFFLHMVFFNLAQGDDKLVTTDTGDDAFTAKHAAGTGLVGGDAIELLRYCEGNACE